MQVMSEDFFVSLIQFVDFCFDYGIISLFLLCMVRVVYYSKMDRKKFFGCSKFILDEFLEKFENFELEMTENIF